MMIRGTIKETSFHLCASARPLPRTDRHVIVPFVQINIVKSINLIYSDGPPQISDTYYIPCILFDISCVT